jgi:hypothetical protein
MSPTVFLRLTTDAPSVVSARRPRAARAHRIVGGDAAVG